MDWNGHGNGGSPPRKKARRGKKKSKAERLARGLILNAGAEIGQTPVSLDALQTMLAAPEATASAIWDCAQAVAMRLDSKEAKQLIVRSLVFDRQAHKAAVHYARRLQLSPMDLVAVLLEGRDDPSQCLAVARFLVDADTQLVDNASRVSQFVLPWLDVQKTDEPHEQQPLPSSFATAARLVLQPNPNSKRQELLAEKLALQRLLVATLLASGHHAMLQYASSLAPVLKNAAREQDKSPVQATWTQAAQAAETQRRSSIASRVEDSLRMLWPDARVVVFGSSATALLAPEDETSSNDDVDLCALLPSCPQWLEETAPLVADIHDHLGLYVGGDVVAVTRARVPIVKWGDAETKLQCDLCVNNVAALWNTQLTIQLTEDPLVREFSLFMKRWYKAHRAKGFASGLSSYGMQLLVFYFLQRRGAVPSSIDCGAVSHDAEALKNQDLVGEIAEKVQQAIRSAAPGSLSQSASLWSLVVEFFAFYGANEFDFEHDVVSLRAPMMKKEHKQWGRRNWRFSLSIEDPIETDRDLGTLFSRVSLTRFRATLVAACMMIAEAHDAGQTSTEEGRTQVLAALLLNSSLEPADSK